MILVRNQQLKQNKPCRFCNFFQTIHSFPKTGAESCKKNPPNMKVHYTFPLNYQLTRHPEFSKANYINFKKD